MHKQKLDGLLSLMIGAETSMTTAIGDQYSLMDVKG